MTDPIVMDREAAEYQAAQVAEWSKWEAREPIDHDGALAYAVGHAVPQSNVDRHGYAKAGKVRLQAAWVAEHPDDDDVKTFLSWAKGHKDHPDVEAWESYRETRADLAAAKVDDNPFAEPPDKPAADERAASARVPRKATSTTTDKE